MSIQSCGRSANAFSTTRSSAEQVVTSTPGAYPYGVARSMTRSSVRQPAQRDVERYAVGCLHEEHASVKRKLTCVRDPRLVVGEDRIDEPFFAAKASQDRQVHIARLTRLAPPLGGQAADDAATPFADATKRLDLDGGREQRVHRCVRPCMRSCIATSPDHSRRCGDTGTRQAACSRRSVARRAARSSRARSSRQRSSSSRRPVSTQFRTYARSASVAMA